METWIWIAIAVVAALLVIAALAWLATRRSRGAAAVQRAESIREDVRERAGDFGERTAAVREREAEAEHAKATADRQRAEAESLEQEAKRQRQAVESERADHRDALRKADEIDPRPNTQRPGT